VVNIAYRVAEETYGSEDPNAGLIDLKDLRSLWEEQSFICQSVDRGTPLIMGIDADQRLRPEAAFGVDRLDLRSDVVGANPGERTGEPLVVGQGDGSEAAGVSRMAGTPLDQVDGVAGAGGDPSDVGSGGSGGSGRGLFRA
jgi:hypothetical protein